MMNDYFDIQHFFKLPVIAFTRSICINQFSQTVVIMFVQLNRKADIDAYFLILCHVISDVKLSHCFLL